MDPFGALSGLGSTGSAKLLTFIEAGAASKEYHGQEVLFLFNGKKVNATLRYRTVGQYVNFELFLNAKVF